MKYRVFTEADEHCNAAWSVLDEKNRGWVVYWRASAEERTGRFAFLDDMPEESCCRAFAIDNRGYCASPMDEQLVGLPKSESLPAMLAKMGIDDWGMAEW